MAIQEHPAKGSLLICDYSPGFEAPEMVKRRPVIVISPRIAARPGLCTVVPLSTRPPRRELPFHCRLRLAPALPQPWDAEECWVKGDMIAAVAFRRLDFVRGRDAYGNRVYRRDTLNPLQWRQVQACVLFGLGLGRLTRSL